MVIVSISLFNALVDTISEILVPPVFHRLAVFGVSFEGFGFGLDIRQGRARNEVLRMLVGLL